ncbi:hypothetical protein HZS_7361 [Henneguya salminicola]|nr:hypothetical protein HZS_7361 [Henneguya salminicola]
MNIITVSQCENVRENFVKITFIERDGTKRIIKAALGSTVLEAAIDNNIEIESACGGTLACTTCHIIFDESWKPKEKLPSPSDLEKDMLDLAYGLTETFS